MRVTAEAAFAEAQYREAAQRLASVAADQKAAGHAIHARKFQQRAFIALNAARVEVFDPDPVVGPDCGCENCRSYRFHLRFDQLSRGQA